MKIRTSIAVGIAAAAVATTGLGVATPASAGAAPAAHGHVAAARALPVYQVRHKPTITGVARVGRILTAHITGVPDNAVVKYQWGYDGGQYGGGIGTRTKSPRLKVPRSVRGTRIMVIAYVTVPGHRTGSARSTETAVVR